LKIKNKLKSWLFQFTYPQVLHPTYVWRLKNKSKISMLLFGFLPISRYSLINQSFREKYWESINNVGTLDEPFVYLNWDLPADSKILDFGCGGSSISLGLSSFGYHVTGIDFRYAGYSHKNFTYLKNDFLKYNFDLNSFDSVLAISVLEHVGMGHYGDEFVENADKISMKKIYDILKPNGIVFISVPGGRKKIYEKNGIKYIRIFDPETIEKLCENFVIEKEYFYKKINQEWISVDRDELIETEYVDEDVGAILIKARKK
jgi:SAM-dependent methyltransferase